MPESALLPRLLTGPDAARYLGVSETTLRGLGLPRKVLGGKRLFDRFTLDEFASGLATEGETARCDSADNAFG